MFIAGRKNAVNRRFTRKSLYLHAKSWVSVHTRILNLLEKENTQHELVSQNQLPEIFHSLVTEEGTALFTL